MARDALFSFPKKEEGRLCHLGSDENYSRETLDGRIKIQYDNVA